MKIRIHRKGVSYGPYSESAVRSFLEEGTLSPTDLAWTHGRDEWTTLEKLLAETETGASAPSDEDKDAIEKIKHLVRNEEKEFAWELVLGLNSDEIVCGLLEDCKINEDGWLELPIWIGRSEIFFLRLLEKLPSAYEDKVDSTIVPTNVRKLCLDRVDGLDGLETLEKLRNLEELELNNIPSLKCIKGLAAFEKLTVLHLRSCDHIREIEDLKPIATLGSLLELDLQGLNVGSTGFLAHNPKLTKLTFQSESPCDLDEIECLKELESLSLQGCRNLGGIEVLSMLPKLSELNLNGCSSVEEKPKRLDWHKLRSLDLCGTSIPMEDCWFPEESGRFDLLVLPDATKIEKFPEGEDSGGVLPRIEFYLGGWGVEAREGNITQAQYDYWKDRSEDELIDHCMWEEENEDIPEDARLGVWDSIDDVSLANGCSSGYLEVTEFRHSEDGWIKKYRSFDIEDGDSMSDELEVYWEQDYRVPPTGPSFRGVSEEKGMFGFHRLEGETFDPAKLKIFSAPVFGGDRGYAVERVEYDEAPLDFYPETLGKGYYFEIMPPPEKELNVVSSSEEGEEEDSADEEQASEEESSEEEPDVDEIISVLEEED